ncbi:MAG: hypothetical protein AAGC74_02410 [Verrucomicrobiota bacterium]
MKIIRVAFLLLVATLLSASLSSCGLLALPAKIIDSATRPLR